MKEPQVKELQDRLHRVKSILVSQPAPADPKSPYYELAKKYDVTIDFYSFIQVERVDIRDFRKQKVNILDFTAIIFTSRNAVDHFFSICKELKIEVSSDMKYFCISEQTANYLQKYITVRKRKLFTGVRTVEDLLPHIKKNKEEKFLYPCSDIRNDELPTLMSKNSIHLTEVVMYNTVAADLSSLAEVKYDIIAFFSPSGVASLFTNFPDFEQGLTRIAAFGPTTAKAVRDAGLILDIEAPLPSAPSMTGALEAYIKLVNKI